MRDITLVMAYYDNPTMLELQAAYWSVLRTETRSHLRVIIVDDGSPEHPATKPDANVPIDIYRIGVDIRWNQDAARNIGVHHAQTEWVLLTDMDHMVPEDTFRRAMEADLDPGRVYRFSRVRMPGPKSYKPHPNSWLLTKALFDKIGGYDERFAGAYGTDIDFQQRMEALVGPAVQTNWPLILYPREVVPDASTTRYERKTEWDTDRKTEVRKARGSAAPLRLTFPYERVA